MIKIIFAELHAPMFLGGKSLGNKLDIAKTQGLNIWYEPKHQDLYISYNSMATILPKTSAMHFVPEDLKFIGMDGKQMLKKVQEFVAHSMSIDAPSKAQPTPGLEVVNKK